MRGVRRGGREKRLPGEWLVVLPPRELQDSVFERAERECERCTLGLSQGRISTLPSLLTPIKMIPSTDTFYRPQPSPLQHFPFPDQLPAYLP